MAKLAADTYGEALFSLAVEENKVDLLFEETEALKAILDQNPDFNVVMNHPKITRDQKEKMIEEVFHGRVSDEITGFLRLLLQKERYKELDAILAFFSARVKEYKGIGVAYVTTAVPLKDSQKAAVERKLLDTTGYKEMEIHYSEDKDLIGGMVIRIGDRVVDSSIRTRLDGLKKSLADIQVG